MSILVDETTRVCVQGATGAAGRRFTAAMLRYGTNVVAGVSPRGGDGSGSLTPVFRSMEEAVAATAPDLSVVFVGGNRVREAVVEAAEAGTAVIVVMAEYVPVWDVVEATAVCRRRGTRLIGPNTNGVITMERAVIGFFPPELSRRGPVGVVSRSGTLAYGVLLGLQHRGIGQSTVVGIGGSPVPGTTIVDCLRLFAADDETEAVVIVGEIGGTGEEDAAEYLRGGYPKPVLALIAGRTAPEGIAVGHAGAIVAAGRGSWRSKHEALTSSGVFVAATIEELAATTAQSLRGSGG